MTVERPMTTAPRNAKSIAGGRVVLLAGPGDSTDIVANYLAQRLPDLVVVLEEPPSRWRLARRRAKRIGWPKVAGQVLFITLALPLLRRRGRQRSRTILAEAGLDASRYQSVHRVSSVNAAATITLLRELDPALVVVNGTRIISRSVLNSVECPFINTHAGITPRYRGVHGGYWALVEGRPDQVGTTIHVVDDGIDTGRILASAHFAPTPEDTLATYPYLHLVAGLPMLAEQIEGVLAGHPLPASRSDAPAAESRLFLHPTLGSYLRQWLRYGVR